MGTHHLFGGPNNSSSWLDRAVGCLLLVLFSELFIAAFFFTLLGFLWGLFKPAWVTKLLYRAHDHFWYVLLFFVGTSFLTILIMSIVR